MKRLLICVDWFDPAIRAGGPITSCINLAQILTASAEVLILTGCKDLGEKENLPYVRCGTWNRWRDRADVWYATKHQHCFGAFYRACLSRRVDAVYLNSMFSVNGAILPLLCAPFLGGKRIVLAPRGMLKSSAIAIRNRRKTNWIGFLKGTGIADRIHFHATSDKEAEEIRFLFGKHASITIIPNVPREPLDGLPNLFKHPGELRLSFVGRVHPIKNLHIVLELISNVRGSCHLDVIGPVEDDSYSERCDKLIGAMPPNIQVTRHGTLPVDESLTLVQKTHAMFLPTQGENFGHSIFEAMGVGVPVLISDQTFWRDLESRKAGWDKPLTKSDNFRDILSSLMAMNQTEHTVWREGALSLARGFFQETDFKGLYLKLFFPDG